MIKKFFLLFVALVVLVNIIKFCAPEWWDEQKRLDAQREAQEAQP